MFVDCSFSITLHNSFAEKTAWVKNHDGFLAIDLNGNGKIDDGGELFGDSFIMPDGNCSKTGFVNETVIESENTIEQNSDAEIEETSGIDTDLVA